MAEPIRQPVFLQLEITADVYKKMDEFKAKWPGLSPTEVMVRVHIAEGHSHEMEYTMQEFLEALGFEDAVQDLKPCEVCNGEGKVATDESDGEGHIMQGVGEADCPHCGLEKVNEDDDR